MQITNNTNTDYYFGPIHLPAGASNVNVDDTDDNSLYLKDDAVADAINTLSAAGKIQVTPSAGVLFPRPTGTPDVLHGDGSPEGLVYAGQGSLFLRRDSGSLYTKKTGVHVNTGWASIAQGAITTRSAWSLGPPSTPNDGDIWIATDCNGNGDGTNWQFQYNAASASTYKWEFIGGTPIQIDDFGSTAQVNTGTQVGSSGYWYRNAKYTTTRAGDWNVSGFMAIDPNTVTGTIFVAGFAGSSGQNPTGQQYLASGTAGNIASAFTQTIIRSAAATTVIGIAVQPPNVVCRFQMASLRVLPVRIS